MKCLPATTTRNTCLKLSLVPLLLGLAACSSSNDDGDDVLGCASGEEASASYCVEYITGAGLDERVGKNTFTLHVKAREGGAPVTGLTIGLSPKMYMVSGMHHATPDEGCVESASIAGDYVCTVYYIMASEMNGVKMGDWELDLDIGGEALTLTPMVMMAMGDTRMAQLKGVNDMIPGMPNMPDENRVYYLFTDDAASTDSFGLFIAARESMMSFPAVYSGQIFNASTAYEMNVGTVAVEISSDDGATWLAAAETGNGHWRITGLGLSAGVANTLRVRLSIDGETKTIDGSASGQAYQTFTVTP